jgi:hypothetical protein
VLRDQRPGQLDRNLLDRLIEVDAPPFVFFKGVVPPEAGAHGLDERTQAFRDLKRDIDSTPDRDAIRRIVEIMAK